MIISITYSLFEVCFILVKSFFIHFYQRDTLLTQDIVESICVPHDYGRDRDFTHRGEMTPHGLVELGTGSPRALNL